MAPYLPRLSVLPPARPLPPPCEGQHCPAHPPHTGCPGANICYGTAPKPAAETHRHPGSEACGNEYRMRPDPNRRTPATNRNTCAITPPGIPSSQNVPQSITHTKPAHVPLKPPTLNSPHALPPPSHILCHSSHCPNRPTAEPPSLPAMYVHTRRDTHTTRQPRLCPPPLSPASRTRLCPPPLPPHFTLASCQQAHEGDTVEGGLITDAQSMGCTMLPMHCMHTAAVPERRCRHVSNLDARDPG